MSKRAKSRTRKSAREAALEARVKELEAKLATTTISAQEAAANRERDLRNARDYPNGYWTPWGYNCGAD
jgi:hypothetical protein